MLLSSISETTYYEKREKNGTSVGFYSTVYCTLQILYYESRINWFLKTDPNKF